MPPPAPRNTTAFIASNLTLSTSELADSPKISTPVLSNNKRSDSVVDGMEDLIDYDDLDDNFSNVRPERTWSLDLTPALNMS